MMKDRTDLDSSTLEKRITRLEEEVKYLKFSREDTLNKKSAHSSYYIPQKDIFVINLERNTPYLDNSPFLMMRNGLPLYDLPRVLGLVFPASTVNAIVGKIEDLGGRGHTYARAGGPTSTLFTLRCSCFLVAALPCVRRGRSRD